MTSIDKVPNLCCPLGFFLFQRFESCCSHSNLDFTMSAQTVNPIKKHLNMAPKSCVKNEIIASNNATNHGSIGNLALL